MLSLIIASASAVLLLLLALLRLRSQLARTEATVRIYEEKAESLGKDLNRMDAEKRLLSGFLGVLPALAQELRHAATERQIATTLIDTLVSTIEPRQAVVLMRRRKRGKDAGAGQHFAVAATTAGSAPVALGLEIVLAEDEHGLANYDGAALRQAGVWLPDPLFTAPLYLDTNVVGLIALTPSAPGSEVPLIVQAVADIGSLALHEASARQRARRVANVDDLTQLFNKRYISRALAEELSKAKHSQRPVSVLLFDIDHFKVYNDRNGHLAGDFLLRLLGQLVQSNLRATDVVGRFGGEEFLVVLPGTLLVEAFLVADKLRGLISAHEFPARRGQPLGSLTVSGGVAECPTHGTWTTSLLRAADQALYAAKREGRNRVVLASAEPLVGPTSVSRIEEEWDES